MATVFDPQNLDGTEFVKLNISSKNFVALKKNWELQLLLFCYSIKIFNNYIEINYNTLIIKTHCQLTYSGSN